MPAGRGPADADCHRWADSRRFGSVAARLCVRMTSSARSARRAPVPGWCPRAQGKRAAAHGPRAGDSARVMLCRHVSRAIAWPRPRGRAGLAKPMLSRGLPGPLRSSSGGRSPGVTTSRAREPSPTSLCFKFCTSALDDCTASGSPRPSHSRPTPSFPLQLLPGADTASNRCTNRRSTGCSAEPSDFMAPSAASF